MANIDFTSLRLFIQVAEAGSLTAGAARTNIAVAAATARIRILEQNLKVSLLERSRGGIELTPVGEVFLRHARLIIRQVQHLEADLAEFSVK